ncbi:hypothetical protein FOC1_g10002784 [Fusarium oxysporum f. sp. cubense race 1]|uniref:DUF676 domain-containing protein n=1 Tax=Fusarium oxysporum f. sp. cubense (strain race 1) TaxID=1229664 RepID=N4UEC1_FUSC1|nr:hypothetical protein FOC1_g10002784 [Fusarium oxysporum f. sp. cubense race 1]
MVAAAEPARKEFPDGVKIWHSPEDAELDICFIHGLSGNRDKTWTAPGQPNPWPAELLPSRLAKARLLTYGYDAFGGIICKTALIISRQSPESHLRQVYNDTKGIAFLGTPHRGSWAADWAKIPAWALGQVKSTNRNILDAGLPSDQSNQIRTQI